MVEVELAYGKGSLRLRVPEALAPPAARLAARAPAPEAEAALFRKALAEAELDVRDPVVVVVPDGTRPLDRAAALSALAPRLEGRRVEVLVGAGLHPAAAPAAPWPVRVHDARGAALARVGRAAGIDVEVDAVLARAATRIVVGAVQPHYLAGFSGGPKGLVPGVAGERTILDLHALADRPRPGVVAGNPFAEAIRACAALLAGRTHYVHLLVGPRGPFDALVGDHDEAVARYRAACAQPRPAPADVVVADAGGHPADATLLQAHKAYEAAAGLAGEAGTVVLFAACTEGFGHAEFERRLRGGTGPFHPYARTAEAWWRKARAHATLMVTELDVTGLGVERVGAGAVAARLPAGARVLWAHRAQDLLFDS